MSLRRNWRPFSLLVVINAFVGAMVGLERSILPALAEDELGLVASSAILSFIVVFGLSKAGTNYLAGRLSDRWGRRPILLAGWAFAAPVPVLLYLAPSWGWVLAANALLGLSQGLTWSTTVVMKIDLAGPRQRGLAMGLNEFAGYLAVALGALGTAALAEEVGLRLPLLLGLVFVALGGGLSLFARETRPGRPHSSSGTPRAVWTASLRDPDLLSSNQAGFVNNLVDGLAWGLFPLAFAAAGLSLGQIGWIAATYPAVWGLGQLLTGPLSDRIGRRPLIAGGMLVQAAGLGLTATSLATASFQGFLLAAVLLGLGTAMVYPTLLAAVADAAQADWRASAVGIYRLWRDAGYAAGALLAGLLADLFGVVPAIWVIALLSAASGLFARLRMRASAPRAPGSASPPEPARPG